MIEGRDHEGPHEGNEGPHGLNHSQAEGVQVRRRIHQKTRDTERAINAVQLINMSVGRQKLHPSHRLHHRWGVVWCWRCGRTATTAAKHLTKNCSHLKVSRGNRESLRRIRQGKTPRTGMDWPLAHGEGPPDGRGLK